MDFAETVDVLKGLPGRIVEVNTSVPDDGGNELTVTSFSGRVDSVQQSPAEGMPETWRLWFKDDGEPKPLPGLVTIRADAFEGADIWHSEREFEDVIEEDDPSGTEWVIKIRQLGVITTLTIYV